jgi:hypothetical protein
LELLKLFLALGNPASAGDGHPRGFRFLSGMRAMGVHAMSLDVPFGDQAFKSAF